MTPIQINSNGLAQIADALGRHHKLGRDHFTPEMIRVWASAVEKNWDGELAYFEIPESESVSGITAVVGIKTNGYNVKYEPKGL